MTFSKGDKVRINRCSRYHDKCPKTDPNHTVVGTITVVHTKSSLTVTWPSGGTNNYGDKDLVKVGE